MNQRKRIDDDITNEKTLELCYSEAKHVKQEIARLGMEKARLENFASSFQVNNEACVKIKHIVKQEVAFNFAEKFQKPVIHMLDKAIANSVRTCKIFDQNKVHIDRGSFLENVSLESLGSGRTKNYRRFRFTEDDSDDIIVDSISPRVPLGTENEIFWNKGDEHDEERHT